MSLNLYTSHFQNGRKGNADANGEPPLRLRKSVIVLSIFLSIFIVLFLFIVLFIFTLETVRKRKKPYGTVRNRTKAYGTVRFHVVTNSTR